MEYLKPNTDWPVGSDAASMQHISETWESGSSGTDPHNHRARPWPAYAAASVVAVATLLLFRGGLPVWITGYLLAAVLAPSFVVLYRVLDRRAQQDIYYTRHQGPPRVAALAVALGLVVGATHAWMIATEIAKR